MRFALLDLVRTAEAITAAFPALDARTTAAVAATAVALHTVRRLARRLRLLGRRRRRIPRSQHDGQAPDTDTLACVEVRSDTRLWTLAGIVEVEPAG